MRKQNIWETISSVEKKEFQQKILGWYEKNKRDLPWRKTQDPYKILVSEVMLQQTQVSRVIQKFMDWMQRWPTVFDFAQASRQDVLTERSGLWFNRRAINLHEACRKIANDAIEIAGVGSNFTWKQAVFQQTPNKMWDKCGKVVSKNMQDYAYLRSLPWVGEYTASAVLAFAYNFELPVIDINIKRVLIASFNLPENISLFDLQALDLSLIPFGQSRDRHNALMDYGSMVLHSKATGIQSAKQSVFKGSDREVRGWILKQLVWNTESFDARWKKQTNLFFNKKTRNLTISDIQTQFPTKDIQKILSWLEKERIVIMQGEKIILL